jgi:CRP/FNR family transcriptional regulator, cyclic AMP receptor protein
MTASSAPTQGALASLEYLGDGTTAWEQFLDLAESSRFFHDFGRDEVGMLAEFMHILRAAPGMPVIQEGGSGDYMVLVLSGRVDVLKQADDGGTQLMATAGPGMTLGEMSMIDGEPRFATCLAIEPTTIAVLTRDEMARIIIERPAVGSKILINLVTLLSQRLRRTSSKLLALLPRGGKI